MDRSRILRRLREADEALTARTDGSRARRQAVAQTALTELQESLSRLNIRHRPSRRLRVAYRRWQWAAPPARVLQAVLLLSICAGLPPQLSHDPWALVSPPVPHGNLNPVPALHRWFESLSHLPGPVFGLVLVTGTTVMGVGAAAYALVLVMSPLVSALFLFWVLRSSHPAFAEIFTAIATKRRYDLLAVAIRGITACSKARAAGTEARPLHLRYVANTVSDVSKAVRKAHRTRGPITAFSHRRRLLKQHAGVVVAALRAAEAQLDVDTDRALTELGTLLLTIAERYTEGRLGRLLDEGQLTGLQPVPDREPLRLALVAVLFSAGTVGIVTAPLPETAQSYLVGACGLLVLTLVYGRGARRALELLTALRGG